MKPVPYPTAIVLIMLQHILQQARGFSFVSKVATTFNRNPQALRLLTTTTRFSPAISRPRHVIQTSTCRPQSHLFSSTSNEVGSAIPITVLSGFLGSGKTTLMQHMLTNNEGLKIAVIVNDVASVNIDSKLVRGRTATPGSTADGDGDGFQENSNEVTAALPAGIVELQNGCACCSISGELLTSVSELMTLSDMRQEDERFDHIVIEMSGVAEPRSVRNIFQEAMMYDMPLMERVSLDTLVTVVDCSTYLDYLRSSRLANALEAPELFHRNEEEKKEKEEGGDGWMGGMQSNLLDGEGGHEGGVCDLLVEQTEVADVILLNKEDIVQGKLEDTKQVVTTLNPRAKVISTSFGKVDLSEIMAITKGQGVALDGVVDDHKDYVSAADAQNCSEPDCSNPLHSHDHSHSHDDPSVDGQLDDAAGCADPGCKDTSHSHSHSHSSDTATHDAAACTEPDCKDTSHSHSQSHSSDTATHDAAACTDLDCKDTSHSHSHSHSSDTALHAGIGTYVYRARRPFHPRRLISILQNLPVVRGVPIEDSSGADDMDERAKKIFKQILRSKGFAWTADSNVKALYWSHAGSSFEMQCLGRWWATLPQQQWPEEAKDSILADYDSMDHDETTASNTTSTVGDRRQEIVFIGPGIGSLDSQAVLKSTLDSCLLNDEEWDKFRSKRDDEASLTYFENSLQTRMLTY